MKQDRRIIQIITKLFFISTFHNDKDVKILETKSHITNKFINISDYHFLSAMLILRILKITFNIYRGIGMAKNMIQFQKGMSIPEFMDNYSTEQKECTLFK